MPAGVYPRPWGRGEADGVGRPGALRLSAALRRVRLAERQRQEAAGRALRTTTRGRSGPANRTRPTGRWGSGSQTAPPGRQPDPLLRGGSARSRLLPRCRTRTRAGRFPPRRPHALGCSVTPGVVVTTARSVGAERPSRPHSRPQSRRGRGAPSTTLGVCIVFGGDLRGGREGWRESGRGLGLQPRASASYGPESGTVAGSR